MKVKDTVEKELFVGIDMHKRSWGIQTATDMFSGKRLTMPADPVKLNPNYAIGGALSSELPARRQAGLH